MTSAVTQLRALIWLRWQMIRSGGVRTALIVTAVGVVWILWVMVRSASLLSDAALAASVELAPAAFLGFGVLAMVAPLTAGGGSQVVPPDQLVAYPVRPATLFLGGLLLAPINLVWVVQLLVLVAETAYLTVDGGRGTGSVTTVAFAVCLTVLGQALAWAVVGLRQTHTGRVAAAALGAASAAALVLVVQLHLSFAVLRASPTHLVVNAITAGPGPRWAVTTAVLLLMSVLGLLLGQRACAWAVRRPGDAGVVTAGREHRRRAPQRSALRELAAIDRASVWRAPALRRGGIVLALLPGIAAIGAAIPWGSLIVLPGLVAAGAGLLFGINAFCLDGSGAVWLASLPHSPRLLASSKLLVLTETVAAAVVISLLTGSLRSPGSPTPTQVSAMLASSVACGSLVIATCMALSVRRPHRADLHGPRDAVAPPGALASASARLALPAGFVGLMLQASSETDTWWFPLLCAAPVLLGSLLWLHRSLSAYDDVRVRARVMQTVSAG